MNKTILALTALAALGTTEVTLAQATGNVTDDTQVAIARLQADKRAVMLDTLALTDQQLAKFMPIYDEYQVEMKKLYTSASKLGNRLFVADYGGISDQSAQDIRKEFFSLRHDRLKLLEKTAAKLDGKLPSTKVLQFVQVENKVQALLDVAAAANIPIVTR